MSELSEKKTKRRSFFYVFTSPLKSSSHTEEELEGIVLRSFQRLEEAFGKEVILHINPNDFHELRTEFGISHLPAFGFSDRKVVKGLLDRHPDASAWNLFMPKKRKQLMAEGFCPLRVERQIIQSCAKEKEAVYYFICDLHITNLDRGLEAVAKKIDSKIRALDIQKAVKTFESGRKFFPRSAD